MTHARRLLGALVAFALVLTACGGDDDAAGDTGDTGGDTTTTGTATDEPTVSLMDLRLGTTPTAATAPVWLADLYGTYEDEGLNVEVIAFRGATDIIAAGVGGSLDLMATGVEQPAFLRAQEAGEWRDIVGILGSSAFALVAQPDLDIEPGDLAAMEGLTIGIPGLGRPAHSVVKALLQQAGLDPETDVEYVEMPSGPPGIPAFEQGTMDVAVTNEPVISALLLRDSAKMYVDLRLGEHGPLSQVPQAVVLAPVETIENERETLDRFVTAVCLAAKRGRENPEEAAELLAEAFAGETDTDTEVLERGLVDTASAWNTPLPEEPIRAWLEVLVSAGTLEGEVPAYEDIVDPSFEPLWTC